MLFRSDLTSLEYYHKYTNLNEFINNCHDYYLLFSLWLLTNDYFDRVYIIRIKNKNTNIKDIIFDINGKKYIRTWVEDLSEVFKLPSPDISFFRGGFKIYDKVVNQNPPHFGKKLYLGTGKRIYPQYGGRYDVYLQEDKKDFNNSETCLPFFKTASPEIFYPIPKTKIEYDICWPANFTQNRYKGQEFFMNVVGHCPKLKNLKIVHCGNKPEVGRRMAKKYNVSNIKFVGSVDRPTLNKYLNKSKFGLCLSNKQDGCPRVATEILMSGTPMILRKMTRLLPYFRKTGVVGVNDNNIITNIMEAFQNHTKLKLDLQKAIKTTLSFNQICQKNIDLWNTI